MKRSGFTLNQSCSFGAESEERFGTLFGANLSLWSFRCHLLTYIGFISSLGKEVKFLLACFY